MDILILEDHPIVLDAIKSRIEQELVGAHISYAGASLEDALRSVDLTKPACAVVDLDLGDGRTPVDIVSPLASRSIPILVMSALGEAAVVKSVFSAGARGYFTKTAALDQLLAAGLVYPCFCTRAEIKAAASAPQGDEGPIYGGTCRALDPAAAAENS